jgi:mRNA-degrading endonuclease RelE of RelBE toxin-antitoxin system
MKFYNHCTEDLSNEAKKIISTKTWNSNYKDQLLLRVEDMLEVGNMIRTNNGGYSVPFKISDVDSIVTIVSDRDE